MPVLIIDYQTCNLGSVRRAFEECGAEVIVSSNPRNLKIATHIVLPGVGAFTEGMKNLTELGWVKPIQETVLGEKIPILGICLGMQLLADKSFENGETEGLHFIQGEVSRFEQKDKKELIPHVGWNELHINQKSPIFIGIHENTDFYFVHSFHLVPGQKKDIIAKTPYCGSFVSAVQKENVIGVQFHPEKSSRPGFQLIKNFLNSVS